MDTSVVIATDIDPLEGELAISAATLAELHCGVLVAEDGSIRAERLRRLSFLQRQFDALPIDEAVSASYDQIADAVVRAGRQPRARSMDLLIAGPQHTRIPPACTCEMPTTSSGSNTSSRSQPSKAPAFWQT